MVCSRGANDGLTPEALDPTAFEGATHLHISGYALLSESQRAAALFAINLARAHGLIVSVDPPPANLIRSAGVAQFIEWLGGVDWVFPNLSEGRVLSGLESPDAIVDALAERFAAGALTLGSDGALGWRGKERARVGLDPVRHGENTGAGDTFAGAFVVGLHITQQIADATQKACRAARSHVARLGDRTAP